MRSARGIAAVVAVAGVAAVSMTLGACGPLAAPAGDTTPASGVDQAQAAHEYPSPSPPAETAAGGAADPARAVIEFATQYTNWTADTVAGQMRSLASRSVGQARSAMELAAAQTAQDYELQRGGIANSGTVEAVAPLLGRRGQYVVVTRELTTATNTSAYQGLHPAWHLALAAVVRLGSGQWVLSRWQPES